MVRDRGQRRMRRIEKRRKHTHRCSGAYLDGIAGQCLRGRPEAARGWLHQALTESTTPRRFHRRVLVQLKHQRLLSKHMKGDLVKYQTGGDWWRRIPRGNTTQVSSERRRPAIPLGGAGGGRWGEWFTQGGDDDGRRSRPEWPGDGGGDPDRQRSRRETGRRASGTGLGRFDRPRPEPGWLSRARVGQLGQQAGWASRPDGPDWLWPIDLKTKFQT
jgi:hypothetical protein